MGFVIKIAAAKLRPTLGEDGFVMLGLSQGRLIRGGPDGAAAFIPQVTKRAPVVASGVFAPAGHGKLFPAAIAAARVGNHHVVSTIGQ